MVHLAPALDLFVVVQSIRRRLSDLENAEKGVKVIAMDHTVWTLFRDAAQGRWDTGRATLLGHPVVRDITVQGWALKVMK